MRLYLLYIVKGRQEFSVGDNIKDFISREDFADKKLLDLSSDFTNELHEAGFMMKQKEGYFDFLGRYIDPKRDEQLINACFVICSSTGKIYGILKINKHK